MRLFLIFAFVLFIFAAATATGADVFGKLFPKGINP